MITEAREYIPSVKPEFRDPDQIIGLRASRAWEKFGARWQRLRDIDAIGVVDASSRLQTIAQTQGLEAALYDARLTIIKGVRDGDPEKGLLARNTAITQAQTNTTRLYWLAYNPRKTREIFAAYYQSRPDLLSKLTFGITDLPPARQKVLEQIIVSEKYDIVGYQNLLAQLKSESPFKILGYSCLATVPGRQQISPILWESKFFKFWPGRLEKFFNKLAKAGVLDEVELTVLLADSEPWDAWGWDETNKDENNKVIDDLLQEGGDRLKSYLGSRAKIARYSKFYTDQRKIVKGLESSLAIPSNFLEEEIALYTRLRGIALANLYDTATRSVINYAAEGLELLQKPPCTILGIESPLRQRDCVYQLARWDNPQPIIHPVKVE